MIDLSQLTEILAVVKTKQSEIALQAFEAHAPWDPGLAMMFLIHAMNASWEDMERMMGHATAAGALVLKDRDTGRELTLVELMEATPETVDNHTLHLGPNWKPTLDTFGISLNVICVDRGAQASPDDAPIPS